MNSSSSTLPSPSAKLFAGASCGSECARAISVLPAAGARARRFSRRNAAATAEVGGGGCAGGGSAFGEPMPDAGDSMAGDGESGASTPALVAGKLTTGDAGAAGAKPSGIARVPGAVVSVDGGVGEMGRAACGEDEERLSAAAGEGVGEVEQVAGEVGDGLALSARSPVGDAGSGDVGVVACTLAPGAGAVTGLPDER